MTERDVKYKILVVDDAADVRSLLKDYFELNNYLVLTAQNGEEALEKAAQNPHIILLDINMPDRDGISVCRRIRNYVSCPILFLTARIEDYRAKSVCVNGRKLGFAKKEFEIIALLSMNAGQVFDRERIYEKVWGLDAEGSSSVVAEHIRRIRIGLSREGMEHHLETVWGMGYKWVK